MNKEEVTYSFKYWIRDRVWVRSNGNIWKDIVSSINITERMVNNEIIDETAYYMKGSSIPFFSDDIAWTKEELQK